MVFHVKHDGGYVNVFVSVHHLNTFAEFSSETSRVSELSPRDESGFLGQMR